LITKSIKWGRIQYNNKLIKEGRLTVGKYTYGVENLIIKNYKGSEANVHIGKFCSIGENITIITGGIHPSSWISTFPLSERFASNKYLQKDMPSTKGDILIGNDVWIAQNCSILSGVRIGNGAIICSGAIVTKDVPDYSIAAGVPAKVIKFRFNVENIQVLNTIEWWSWSEDKIEKNIKLLSSSNLDEFLTLHKIKENGNI
jgi:acetyltransferase-like isoleucine patch superfamily enzyme